MNKKGFTLLELAIVLIIVGVLSAGAMKILFGAFNSNKQTATKNNIALIVKDIAAYTVKGKQIPTALSQATSLANDAFGNPLVYLFSGNLSGIDICSVQTAELSINGAVTENNIAFLVISHGEDGQQQYAVSGNTYTFNNGNDDVVGWMNLGTLQAMAGCDGSLGIEQNKLPDAIVSNTYAFKLTPKGGTSPYKWCVESDNSATVKNQMYFGTGTGDTSHSIKNTGDCTSANGVTNATITLHSAADPLEIDESDSGSALIKVRLEDANGITITKNFDLRVLRDFEVAMDAPESTPPTETPVVDGDTSNFISSTPNDQTQSDLNKNIDVSADQIDIMLNTSNPIVSVFYNCDANPNATTNACPPFGNKRFLTAYFLAEYSRDNQSSWYKAMGYVFAIIKSYKPGTTYESTVKTVGSLGEGGLGYGASGGDGNYAEGINGGNSFGIEFDLMQSSSYGDKNDNHMAVVSRADIMNQGGIARGNNSHKSRTDGNPYYLYNDVCSTTTGSGCYYSTNASTPLIPNTFSGGKKIGVRVEAISGCNSTGSSCTGLSGTNNYVCIYVWRKEENTLTADPTLKTNMQDMFKSHIYEKIKNNTTIPLGDPMLKDCVPDNTSSPNTLDYVRFGFTSGHYYGLGTVDKNHLHYRFTDFKFNTKKYMD
jgi:prepilin-type N-terminal cleavage/methylation domain-containing protein